MNRFERLRSGPQEPHTAKFALPGHREMVPVLTLNQVLFYAGMLSQQVDPESRVSHDINTVRLRTDTFLRGEGRLPHLEPARARRIGRFVTDEQGGMISVMKVNLPTSHFGEFYDNPLPEIKQNVSDVMAFCNAVADSGAIALATFHQYPKWPLNE
jgi:hypothetical protein